MTIFVHKTSLPFIWYAKYNSTASNAEVVSENAIFWKFGLKFSKNYFFEISLHFLREDAIPFHLTGKLLFYYQEDFSILAKKVKIFCLSLKNQKFSNIILVCRE